MSDMSLEEAEARLREHGGYEWALSGRQMWSAADITAKLTDMGMKVSKDTVTRWIKAMPNMQDFGGMGIFASRADLILFLAGRFKSEDGLEQAN